MTDEQIFQILKKHVMGYTAELARHPYGWLTALLDAQKEIQAEAMRLDSIGFAEWISCSGWEVHGKIAVFGDEIYWQHLGPAITTDALYNEYLKTTPNA